MGKETDEALDAYTKSTTSLLINAFNEGYELGLRAATQIYK